jgi:hypothetical protein
MGDFHSGKEKIMGVLLAKLSDGVREDVPGAGTNHGPGVIQFIGGMPSRRVNGPLIRVSGMRVRLPGNIAGPPVVRAVAVAIEPDGFRDREGTVPSYVGTVITSEGDEYATGVRGSLEFVRREWLRFAVETGTFNGISRMR